MAYTHTLIFLRSSYSRAINTVISSAAVLWGRMTSKPAGHLLPGMDDPRVSPSVPSQWGCGWLAQLGGPGSFRAATHFISRRAARPEKFVAAGVVGPRLLAVAS